MNKELTYIGYFDGSCNPNPNGEMGMGVFITQGEKEYKWAKKIPSNKNNTNNVAEYMALIMLLEWFILSEQTSAHIIIKGDSEMVISQMLGKKKIKKGKYAKYALDARGMLKAFINTELEWIPREQNTKADELSKTEI